MPKKINPLHYAGIKILSGSRSERVPASLRLITRLTSRTRPSASSRFLRVSARVRPCVFTPESSSIQPRYHFPLFLYTAVNCCFIRQYYHASINFSKPKRLIPAHLSDPLFSFLYLTLTLVTELPLAIQTELVTLSKVTPCELLAILDV